MAIYTELDLKEYVNYMATYPGNSYKMRIESLCGALTPVSEEETRMMDKKVGYLEPNGKYTNEIVDELLDEEKNRFNLL